MKTSANKIIYKDLEKILTARLHLRDYKKFDNINLFNDEVTFDSDIKGFLFDGNHLVVNPHLLHNENIENVELGIVKEYERFLNATKNNEDLDHDNKDKRKEKQEKIDQKVEKRKRQEIRMSDTMKDDESSGDLPNEVLRRIKEKERNAFNWHKVLIDFIQHDIHDYSFCPPDKRYMDTDFFLPDYNDEVDKVEDILFMIDTSGSMNDDIINNVYYKLKDAISEFNGKLSGYLGFFDAKVYDPIPFQDMKDFEKIKVKGGGGTNYYIIFNYIKEHMSDKNIKAVIILTDGIAYYPKKTDAMGLPVLWLLTNDEETPPWGRVVRIND